jgi:NAD(P)H-nitrite reductase large subunit
LLTSERTASSLWPEAVAQGFTAAHTIAGFPKPYPGALTITSSHIFDTTFVTCGNSFNDSPYESRYKSDETSYHRFYIKNGVIKGFIMVGNVAQVGQLRKAIIEQTSVFSL